MGIIGPHIIMQCSVGRPWILLFVWMPFNTNHLPNTFTDRIPPIIKTKLLNGKLNGADAGYSEKCVVVIVAFMNSLSKQLVRQLLTDTPGKNPKNIKLD